MLEPGGTFASFGNPIRLADPALEQAVFDAQEPLLRTEDLVPPGLPPDGDDMQWPGTELRESEWFTDVEEVTVNRQFAMPSSAYIDQLSTVSAYVVLPATTREQIWTRIRAVLPEGVDILADVTVHLARKSS